MGDIIASIDEALHICVQQDAQIEIIREELKAKDAEIDRLRANLERLTNNPADYRYWEGRYRDEAADNARLRAALREIVDLAGWEPTRATNIARRALEAKDD